MMRRHEFINEAVAAEILALIHQTADPAVLAERLNDYHDYDIAQALEKLTPEERLDCSCPWVPCVWQRSCPTAMSRSRHLPASRQTRPLQSWTAWIRMKQPKFWKSCPRRPAA